MSCQDAQSPQDESGMKTENEGFVLKLLWFYTQFLNSVSRVSEWVSTSGFYGPVSCTGLAAPVLQHYSEATPSCSITVKLTGCVCAAQVLSLPSPERREWIGAHHFPKCLSKQLHAASQRWRRCASSANGEWAWVTGKVTPLAVCSWYLMPSQPRKSWLGMKLRSSNHKL